ncbi:MAG: hypothetical protein IKE91_05225 [Clostridia bacterium]|nr:hypothetical protein [Clostridia bacterium]
MKKEYIIGGCIGLAFVIAIIVCMIVGLFHKKEAPYTPTIAKIINIDDNGEIKEEETKASFENDNKSKVNEYAEQIKTSAQSERYSMIIMPDYVIHIDKNISIKFKSNIKEYVAYLDTTKEGKEREIVTKAPDGFIDWVLEQIGEE